ncbi:MAG: hypothetical protein M3N91_09735 [Pseudomonadota bacterium]|nr:hypothetical protein [Pseudomonadota bacterium]
MRTRPQDQTVYCSWMAIPRISAKTIGLGFYRELRNPGRLSLDECAGENQFRARQARGGKTSRRAKKSLFNDVA